MLLLLVPATNPVNPRIVVVLVVIHMSTSLPLLSFFKLRVYLVCAGGHRVSAGIASVRTASLGFLPSFFSCFLDKSRDTRRKVVVDETGACFSFVHPPPPRQKRQPPRKRPASGCCSCLL